MGMELENEIWSALRLARQEERKMVSHLLLMAVMECRLTVGDDERGDYGRQPTMTNLQRETVIEARIS